MGSHTSCRLMRRLGRVTALLGGLALLVSAVAAAAQAERLHLKSGEEVRGRVVENGDDKIVVELSNGGRVPYWRDEIDRIEQEPPPSRGEPVPVAPAGRPSSAVAVDLPPQTIVTADPDLELMGIGIRLIPPQGWRRAVGPMGVQFIRGGATGTSVITVSRPKRVPPGFATFMWMMLKATKHAAEEQTTFLDVPCRIFTYRETDKHGRVGQFKIYQLVKGGKLYSLSLFAPVEVYDAVLLDFEHARASFDVQE